MRISKTADFKAFYSKNGILPLIFDGQKYLCSTRAQPEKATQNKNILENFISEYVHFRFVLIKLGDIFMNEFIKAIFLSDNCGVEKFRLPKNKEYARINKKEDELYEKLKASLSPELFKLLDDFINTLLDRHAIISEQYYTAGFKIGLRIAIEAFDLSDIFDS